MKENESSMKVFVIAVSIAILILVIITIKTICDVNTYNKCFVKKHDEKFNYNICLKYLDY